MLYEADAAIERQPQNAFQQIAAAFDAIVNQVGFGLFGGDYRADIFQEIDAAFFTFAADALGVVAGRAFEAQGGVAFRAEAGHIARVGSAFWAFVGCGRGLRG
jgi:hypothetical protein